MLIYKLDLGETLGEHLKALKVRRLGFEAAHLTYRQHQRLTQAVADAGLTVAWQPLEGWWRACARGRPRPSWPSCGGP